MSTPVRLAGFVATLAVLFAGGALAGGAVGPDRGTGVERPAEQTAAEDGHGGAGMAAMGSRPVRGLAVADHGGRAQTVAFTQEVH